MANEPVLSLEQYAGICAARAAGIALEAVLAQEQVAPAALIEAEPIWRERVATSVATQLELTDKLRVAEECLARTIEPVEEDPAAWVGLLGALATSPDQGTLLAKLGITLVDVGRLGRVWRARALADPPLGERLAELAATAPPCPTLRVAAVALRPFPWSPTTAASSAPSRAEASADPLERFDAEQPRVERVLASFQRAPVAVAEPSPAALARPDALASQPGGHDISAAPEGWSLERYAQMAAALRARPARAEAIMTAQGLASPEQRRLLHEHFRALFARDGVSRGRFEALLAQGGGAFGARTVQTDEVDVAALRGKRPLPFEAPAAAPAQAERRERVERRHSAEDAAVIARMRAHSVGASGSGTVAVDAAAPRGAAIPFELAAGAPFGWSLQRYVALCADVARGDEPAALARAGIDAAARRALDGYFSAKIARDPAVAAEWQRLTRPRSG